MDNTKSSVGDTTMAKEVRITTKITPKDLEHFIGKRVNVSCICPQGFHEGHYNGIFGEVDKEGFIVKDDEYFGIATGNWEKKQKIVL